MFWHMFDISINDFDCAAPIHVLMDTQHSLFQPSTYFGVACVAFSVIALTGIWRSTSAKSEVRAPELRPKPRRRIAVDSLYAADTAGANAQPESALTVLADLIAWSARISESLRRSSGGHVATAVLSELALVTGSLCRLQAVVVRDAQAIRPGTGLGACFTASTSSLNATYNLIDSQRSASSDFSSPSLLNDALQQLRAQRSALDYLLETMSQNELPPTPPASDEGSDMLKPSDALRLPFESMQMPTGITPGLDGRGWIEPPPEYSPPSSSSAYPVPEKFDSKSAHAVEPEIETGTGDANTEALYQAATENDIETLSSLLEAGLQANDTFGELQRTALHQAAHLNHTATLSILLRHGADMSLEDTKGDAALHLAAWAGNVEALSSLLAHGADVDHLSGRDGYSPLWCAITAYHIDVARLLLKHGARVSLRSGTGLSPLHQAAVTGQSAMCELLLERGAQVDTTDDDVNTPLHYAAVSGSVSSVRVLLRGGADVQAKQAQGLTSLHWAAHKGHVEVLALLLEYGASINARAEEGATPLHLGANRGHLAVVRSLLENGARTDIEDAVWDGVEGSAAEMAKDKGHSRVAKVIREWKGSQ
nr:hypothetical protein B0A51_13087 [Rachicladosporium sp. CCFEE 5018]